MKLRIFLLVGTVSFSASALEMRTLTKDLIRKQGAGVFDAGPAVCLMTEKETICYVKRKNTSEVREFSLGNPNWVSVSYTPLEGRRPFCAGYDSHSYCATSIMRFSRLGSNWMEMVNSTSLKNLIEEEKPFPLKGLIDPEKVQVNPMGVCWQESAGVLCARLIPTHGNGDFFEPFRKFIGLAYGDSNFLYESPRLSRVSIGGYALCGTVDGEVVCYGTEELFIKRDDLYNIYPNGNFWEVPGELMSRLKIRIQNPSEMSAGVQHVCARTDEGVICWGNNDKGQTQVPTSENPTMLTSGENFSCAQDGEAARCWGEVPENLKGVNAFTFPIRGLTSACRLSHERIDCSQIKMDFNFDQWDAFSKKLEASLPGFPGFEFSILTLEKDLRKLAEAAYPAKKKLLESTASILEKEAAVNIQKPLAANYKGAFARILAMSVLEPMLKEIAGGNLEMVRRFQKVLEEGKQSFGISKTEDIEALRAVQKTAVQMILFGLQGAKSSLASSEAEGDLNALVTAVTKVLATAGNFSPEETSLTIAGLIQKNTNTMAVLLQEPRARTFAEMAQNLARYLLVAVQRGGR